MDFLSLFSNVTNITWQQAVMWVIGAILIYLAIKKDMEPSLLLPMGFGAILVNLPLSGAVTQIYDGVAEIGVIDVLFNSGIANELFSAAFVCRHRRNDRFRSPAFKPKADDIRCGGTVRNILYSVRCRSFGL